MPCYGDQLRLHRHAQPDRPAAGRRRDHSGDGARHAALARADEILRPLRRADRACARRLCAEMHRPGHRAFSAQRPGGDHAGDQRRARLLGQSHKFPIERNMYSTLAGFVEPGESLEDSVRREVFEEVGVQGRRGGVSLQPALAVPRFADARLPCRGIDRGDRARNRGDAGCTLVYARRRSRTIANSASTCRGMIRSPGA